MLKKGPHTLTVWNRLITAFATLALVMGNLAIPLNVTAQAPSAPRGACGGSDQHNDPECHQRGG